ncbi:Panacea domain-containing protein [Sphingomonas melonis]|uniref:Uncharacterized protein YwgA n=1 Tax=Sphingomonas melonis TaxID=152682 RepID=A0A7Y9K445_9SPHN|nr:Panacea domain-containing protein [Sphingomonas melonis]NYD91639.1 uncharacterized protein YwgA [Sphingomonas melonis]
MADLIDMVGYLCENYPHKSELSKARLTKMVYLADWKASLEEGSQISEIEWKFNHYGPYVDDVVNTARSDEDFKITTEQNAYGDIKDRIVLKRTRRWRSLTESDKAALDHVIEQTKSLYWKDFIKLVYSTFPVMVSERQSILDLPTLAKRYRKQMRKATA